MNLSSHNVYNTYVAREFAKSFEIIVVLQVSTCM